MTRINIVAFENGVGNSRDLTLVHGALAALGCEVTITRVGPRERRWRRSWFSYALARLRLRASAGRRDYRFDFTLMMEHVWPAQLHHARTNIVMPNPEWFDRGDRRLLRLVDRVWTKTGHSHAAFTALGCRATPTGFDSEDRYDATVPRAPVFFHLAGKSRMKGTGRLVALWARHPEWPTLTVVHSRRAAFPIVTAPNIAYRSEFLTDAALRELQNAQAFHLCLSETEGWGHYIPEAESVGAVVIATDAAPMNELVTAERGLLLRSTVHGRQHLADLHSFDEADLERAIERALAMTPEQRAGLGHAARAWFLENKSGFTARLGRALAEAGRS